MKQKEASRSDDESPPLEMPQELPPRLLEEMENGLPDTVSANLHQAREILRLARVMKKEAEDMRREAQQELELARRERHDAEILKKNATEILRMAKEKLHPPT